MRLFVSIAVPAPIRDALAAFQSHLAGSCTDSDIRWTRPDHIHLTLEFLGEVAPDRLPPLAETIRVACAPCSPLTLRLGPPGAFPHLQRPRILWVGVESLDRGLFVLQERLHSSIGSFAQSLEKRPFHPHLTLARVKHLAANAATALQHHLMAWTPPAQQPWDVNAVELMRSHLHAHGSNYERLSLAPLCGALHAPVAPHGS